MLRSKKVEPMRTSFRSPWQNGIAERFVATVRRELLDHAMVLNEHHLRQLLDSFISYCNQDRTHLGISEESPLGRAFGSLPTSVLGLRVARGRFLRGPSALLNQVRRPPDARTMSW
jgi:hypothetical protein